MLRRFFAWNKSTLKIGGAMSPKMRVAVLIWLLVFITDNAFKPIQTEWYYSLSMLTLILCNVKITNTLVKLVKAMRTKN